MAIAVPRNAAQVGATGQVGRTTGPQSRRRTARIGLAVRVVVAVLVAVLMAFPLWVMLVTAISGNSVFSTELELWPKRITGANFARVFSAWPVGTWFANSVTVTALTTILTVVVSVLAGYGFAKLRFPAKGPLFLLLLATMMIPTQAILVPQFRLVNAMGLVGTFWAVIIPGAASTFGIFLARQFFLAIPDELLEAARVDGAGQFRTFASIVMPLSKPLIAVLVLLSFMNESNALAWPLIALFSNQEAFTLPLGIVTDLKGQYTSNYGAIMAVTLLAITPMVILFVSFQRYFVQGLARTGNK